MKEDPCKTREVLVRRAIKDEAAMEAMSMKNDEGGRRAPRGEGGGERQGPEPPLWPWEKSFTKNKGLGESVSGLRTKTF